MSQRVSKKMAEDPAKELSHGAWPQPTRRILSTRGGLPATAPVVHRREWQTFAHYVRAPPSDAAYKKFAMKGNKEHPLVSILVFVIGTLVGVSEALPDWPGSSLASPSSPRVGPESGLAWVWLPARLLHAPILAASRTACAYPRTPLTIALILGCPAAGGSADHLR
jgi:hypothetical protein